MIENPKGVSGLFTIHYEVDADTHDLLAALGRKQKSTPNQVAKDILIAWLRDTEKAILAAQKQKEASEKRIIVP